MPDRSSKKVLKKKYLTLKRLKNAVLILTGLAVIFLAISFTLIRVAIKSIPDYSSAIQQAVSEKMDLSLKVGFMDAEIYWLVPRLNLFDVNIFEKDGKHLLVHLDEIDLSLDWSESIRTMMPVVGEITLTGMNIRLGINKNSQLVFQDYILNENIDETLKSASNNQNEFEISDTLKSYFNNLNFKVLESQIQFFDERQKGRDKVFSNISLHLINSGSSHMFEVKADLPQRYGRYAHFIIAVDGDLFDYKNLDGELYLALENINAASWIDDYWSEINIAANADINGRFWLEWSGQEILDVTSRVNISNLALHYLDKSVNTWNVKAIEARVHWQKDDEDWRLDIRDLMVNRKGINWLKPAAVTLEMLNTRQVVKLQSDFLRIEGFAYLAGMLQNAKDVDIPWLNLLDKYKPAGELKNLDIELPINELQDIKINTEFSQLGFSMPGSEPSEINNLQGTVAYLDNKTWLNLDSKNVEIKFNRLFRNSINLKKLNGTIKLSHKNKLWQFSSNSLHINTPHIETQSRVHFKMQDNERPFLDLTSNFKNGEGTAISLYLPTGVMGKNAVSWIDRAIKSGRMIDGGYQFYGYLSDAPFRGSEGVSLADFNARGVNLRYLKNWPHIKDISANLRFENDSLFIMAEHARVFDSEIKDTVVYIDNFVSPTLDVKGSVNVNLQDIKKYVNASSLREDVTDYIDNLKFSGQGDLNLELFLPLYGDFHTEIGGKLMVQNGRLNFIKEKYELNNIKGEIRFAGDTVESSGLVAELTGNVPGRLLDIGVRTNNRKDERLYHIDVKGKVLASSLVVPVPKLKEYLKGSASWNIGIDIMNNKVDRKTTVSARVTSDLLGVTSSLPGPLSKVSTAAAPMKMQIMIKPDSYADYTMVLHNDDKFGLQHFKNKILISSNAKDLKGNVGINTRKDVDLPIQINLEYLNLNKFYSKDDVSVEGGSVPLPGKQPTAISPRNLPSFDLYAERLKWKQSIYKESTLKMQKSKLGAVIKSFKFVGEDHVVKGKGSWFTGKNDVNTTKLDIDIKVDDLGNVFKEMEISDSLFETRGDIKLRWHWKDAPYNFDWKKVEGDGSLHLEDGVLKDLDAGAGRLLGLFNFKTLLSLDFGDQMREGFGFDKVKGSFSFSNENIYSDDFKIESTVATVFMKGKLSVANNTLDQTVTVRPHIGGTVTLGTAVVAGPAVGGLVYLFQKIFNTDRLSEYQYSLKGSIDNPEVKLISVPVTEEDEEEDSDF